MIVSRTPIRKRCLTVESIRSKNITLIAAISSQKVWTIHLENGSVKQKIFSIFLEKLFNDQTINGIQSALLIIDNVRFHKTNLIVERIESSGLKR